MSQLLRIGKTIGLFAWLALTMASGSSAHPHIMIIAEVSLEIKDGALIAIRQRWTFDEAYRISTFEEFDKDRNGLLDPDEMRALLSLAASTMERFRNFTTIEVGRTKARTQPVVFTAVEFAAARPVIELTLALVEPMAVTEPIVIQVYDPTYYSAFNITTVAPLSLEGELRWVCSATLTAPPKEGEQLKAYRAFATMFGPLAARLAKPQAITLTCGALQPALAVSGDGMLVKKSDSR